MGTQCNKIAGEIFLWAAGKGDMPNAGKMADELNRLQALNAELVEALEAIDAQISEIGRYSDSPDAYAEIPWETVDQFRAVLAKARDHG